ncbi:UvrB/UvrC motif-containing protein [Sphingomonas prati]|uniref:UVR domain-containing protein n=1 Tax=Sphingomonas prati TaxID=1843237 RepID=A0A7W9BP89_9SPHN|nr:UvrB/UvrC motif-containing protein [Sphingomonas prati]MBB5727574.1 hypothetical protein [Sphingomonas prati]GGE79074.1 hypothetical protein GCM10011404_09670 [Sphingomonas prati]
MTDTIADLRRRMDAAAAALDFEEAQRLRNALAALETDGLREQQPGAMGLGTSQQRMQPPPGWVRPTKPDNMTTGRPKPRRRGA